ncbi:MAG: hypothetical protein ABJN98_06780 [Roseibium sp.]
MSFETFVKSTNLEEINPLSPGGLPLFRSHDVLIRELSARISPEHAMFFAEPEISETSDRVDWYGSGGNLRKLTSLNDKEQAAAKLKVAALYNDISNLAVSLETSEDSDERYLSRLLVHALRIPSDENIFVGTHGPLITEWGALTRGPETEYHVLKILHDEAEAERSKPLDPHDESQARLAQSEVERTAPVNLPRRGKLPAIPLGFYIASFLGTAILVPAILFLLLSSCGVRLPTFLSGLHGSLILSYCDSNTQKETLINLISSYEREIQERQEQCTGNEDTAQAEPAPAVPETPTISGVATIKDIEPPIGLMCAAVVCENGLTTIAADASCDKVGSLDANQFPDIANGYCRAFIYPIQFAVDAGTSFSAQYEVSAQGQTYKAFNVEAETYSQQLLDALEKNRHPRLYWVADFPWPPKDTATDRKGAD